MAILIYLKGQKSPIILKESEQEFRNAIEAAYGLKKNGHPAAIAEFRGWHNKTIWINDLLGALDYASEESDKEIQKSQNEAKKQEYEKKKAMKKAMDRAAAEGRGPGGGGRVLNIPGYPGPGRGGQG